MNRFHSWGNYPVSKNFTQKPRYLNSREKVDLSVSKNETLLPFGNGRSYGDSCLNNGGSLLLTRGLNRFIHFDSERGILKCEAGVLLSEVIDLILPYGWFLMVTPGTKFVTIGGAIANDVHGKNHHKAGAFGCDILGFELVRSDGQTLLCKKNQNSKLFKATIGGLGLTGVITWVEFSLKKVKSSFMDVETFNFNNIDEFFQLSLESDISHEYTVAWLDSSAKGSSIGRGVFKRANHSSNGPLNPLVSSKINFPIKIPFSLINMPSVKIFNALYRWNHSKKQGLNIENINSFFYPLDSISNWNRIYGNKGFLQYQFVIPIKNAKNVINEILRIISISGQGSFLNVLKIFGDIKSPGMLSFPRSGVTLALDFPNKGEKLFRLLYELEQLIVDSDGAIYPAKDAMMSKNTFSSAFLRLEEFSKCIDPVFSSSFWRRVTEEQS